MPYEGDPEATIREYQGWIDEVVARVCRKSGIGEDEVREVGAWVWKNLRADDYAILRSFRGEAGFKTFIVATIVRQVEGYCRQRQGSWRASPLAVQLGRAAVELEALVHRDGCTVEEAGARLRQSGLTTLTDEELARLLRYLSSGQVDGKPFLDSHAERALWFGHALQALEPESRVIARMYFGERYRFADVARVLGTDHQALLRRIDTLRPLLRRNLEGEGLPPELVSRLLERTEPVGADGFVLAKGLTSGETILYRVQEAPDKVYSLSPREFEELVAELLHRQGFQVTLTPPSRDGGFDMYAVRKDSLVETLYLVECKRYARTNRVGVEIVRALMGVVDTERANAGIIVTTSTFTQGAREFQRRLQNVLSLRDNRYLYDWLMLSRVPLSEAAG